MTTPARRRVLAPGSSGGGGGPSLVGWWKADAITGLSDGDPIGSCADSSGDGLTATASGSQRPTYKSAIVNGLPVIRIAAGQWLAFTPPSLTDMTCILVHTVAAGTTGYGGPFCCRPSGSSGFAINDNGGGTGQWWPDLTQYSGSSEASDTKAGTGYISTPAAAMCYSWVVSGGTAAAWINGVSQTIAGGTGGWGNSGGLLGQAYGTSFEGDLCEILLYNGPLSSGARSAEEGSLSTKWGLGF